VFFFEKKNQKTFIPWAGGCAGQRYLLIKSFLLLFFKKEGLSSLIL